MSMFTAPSFLRMPAIGIDISTDVIRFVDLKKQSGGIRVRRYGSTPVPVGMVQKGCVQDAVGLSLIIAELAKKEGITLANVALPEEQAFLVEMEIPKVIGMDLRTAVEVHLEEYIPISPSDVEFDFVLQDTEKAGSYVVTACAFPKNIIEQYLEVFRGTGITVKSFELQSQAMARAVCPRKKQDVLMCVDIGRDITNVFIAKGETVHFSAMLDSAGEHVSKSIARVKNILFEEAEALKIAYGLIGESPKGNLRDGIAPALADLTQRIQRYIAFWSSRHGEGAPIVKIHLTGGGANLQGLAEYLGREIAIPVVVANPWVNAFHLDEYTPPIEMNLALGYSAAIGLALRDEELLS